MRLRRTSVGTGNVEKRATRRCHYDGPSDHRVPFVARHRGTRLHERHADRERATRTRPERKEKRNHQREAICHARRKCRDLRVSYRVSSQRLHVQTHSRALTPRRGEREDYARALHNDNRRNAALSVPPDYNCHHSSRRRLLFVSSIVVSPRTVVKSAARRPCVHDAIKRHAEQHSHLCPLEPCSGTRAHDAAYIISRHLACRVPFLPVSWRSSRTEFHGVPNPLRGGDARIKHSQ